MAKDAKFFLAFFLCFFTCYYIQEEQRKSKEYICIGSFNFHQQNHNNENLGGFKGLECQTIIVLGLNVSFKI